MNWTRIKSLSHDIYATTHGTRLIRLFDGIAPAFMKEDFGYEQAPPSFLLLHLSIVFSPPGAVQQIHIPVSLTINANQTISPPAIISGGRVAALSLSW
jgi:hypothetical protein